MVNKIQSYLDKILSAKTNIKKALIQMNVTNVTNKFSTYPDKIDEIDSIPRITINSEILPIAKLNNDNKVIRNAEELIVADSVTEVEGYNKNLVSGELIVSGTYTTSSYSYPTGGIRTAFTGSNGSIYIICQGHNTTSYENIHFILKSNAYPEGASIVNQTKYNNTSTTTGGLYICKITGITKPVKISIEVTGRNSSSDFYTYSVTLSEV